MVKNICPLQRSYRTSWPVDFPAMVLFQWWPLTRRWSLREWTKVYMTDIPSKRSRLAAWHLTTLTLQRIQAGSEPLRSTWCKGFGIQSSSLKAILPYVLLFDAAARAIPPTSYTCTSGFFLQCRYPLPLVHSKHPKTGLFEADKSPAIPEVTQAWCCCYIWPWWIPQRLDPKGAMKVKRIEQPGAS